MKIAKQIVVFDAADLATESAFWAAVLGGRVVADDVLPIAQALRAE